MYMRVFVCVRTPVCSHYVSWAECRTRRVPSHPSKAMSRMTNTGWKQKDTSHLHVVVLQLLGSFSGLQRAGSDLTTDNSWTCILFHPTSRTRAQLAWDRISNSNSNSGQDVVITRDRMVRSTHRTTRNLINSFSSHFHSNQRLLAGRILQSPECQLIRLSRHLLLETHGPRGKPFSAYSSPQKY